MNAKRTIVLTGCTRGLGLSLLHQFSNAGHTVYGGGRSQTAIDTLKALSLAGCHLSVLDVSEEDSVKSFSEQILQNGHVPDLLINNAGIINHATPLWQVPAEEFQSVIDINIAGVHRVIRHLVPAMIEQGKGIIVNLSSGWGRSVAPEVAPYCASKWAIEGMSKALAEELPAGMAAIPLSPGVIATDMLRQVWGDSANVYPTADVWAAKAAPYILSLGASDNGCSLTTP